MGSMMARVVDTFDIRQVDPTNPHPFGERNLAQSSDGPQPP